MFSDPVIGEDFFDRKPILDLLAKRIEGLAGGYRQNIGILGRRLLGKTSLLLHFLSTFKDKNALPVYVDLKAEGFDQFAYRFMVALLYNFLKAIDKPVVEDFNILITNSLEFIPKTVENMRRVEGCLEKRQFAQAYNYLLDLTALLREESGKRPVVILDEFHRLGNFKMVDPFPNLGKKIMAQKDTMYVITSSSVKLAKEILKEKLSLQFGNFEIIELTPFDFETSKGLLDERLKWMNVPTIYKSFLIALTGGHPFYLDILSLKLKKIAIEKKMGKVPLELVSQTLEDEMFSSRGILNQYLATRINQLQQCRGFTSYISILLAIAGGNGKLYELSKFIKKKIGEIAKTIAKLVEMDFIQRYGSFYRINDLILKLWLKSVYQRRQMSLTSDIFSKSREFRHDVSEMALQFANESKRNIHDRVRELFGLFRNETVEIGQRRYKLPNFAEVESRVVRDVELPIVARWGEKYWIVQIAEKDVTENEVAEFAQKCKKARYKVQRKILIALKGLEINAKLLAKEEKIWLWGLDELNLLLDLYGKPQIVK